MGLGVVFANQLVKWDVQLQEDLDKMLDKAKAANERRYFGIKPNPNLICLSDHHLYNYICGFYNIMYFDSAFEFGTTFFVYLFTFAIKSMTTHTT